MQEIYTELEKHRISSRPNVYKMYAKDMDDLSRAISAEVKSRTVERLKVIYRLGMIKFYSNNPRINNMLYARLIEYKTLEEVAREFGVTRERIRQIELKQMEILKETHAQ